MVAKRIPTTGQLTVHAVCGVAARRRYMSRQSHGDAFDQALAQAVERGFVAAFRWLGNRDSAREACQEAAAKTLNARQTYDPSKPLYPWFYRILRNHCLDRLRRDRRDGNSNVAVGLVNADIATQNSAEESVDARQREAAVNRAIVALPADLREIIELRHFQDMSYREMSEALDIPVGTVMSKLYRARMKLRESLLNKDIKGNWPRESGDRGQVIPQAKSAVRQQDYEISWQFSDPKAEGKGAEREHAVGFLPPPS